jgi:hypothetical protein
MPLGPGAGPSQTGALSDQGCETRLARLFLRTCLQLKRGKWIERLEDLVELVRLAPGAQDATPHMQG